MITTVVIVVIVVAIVVPRFRRTQSPESRFLRESKPFGESQSLASRGTPNPPTNIVPTNIARLKLSGKSPMDMRTPPLKINMVLESNPRKSTMLVGRLGVCSSRILRDSDSQFADWPDAPRATAP